LVDSRISLKNLEALYKRHVKKPIPTYEEMYKIIENGKKNKKNSERKGIGMELEIGIGNK